MTFEAERETLGPFTVRVIADDHAPESPRKWCNLGTFYTSHPNYRSPDAWSDRYHGIVYQVAADLGIRPDPQRDHDGRFIQFDTFEDDAGKMMEKARKAGHIVLPVWMYEHSGVAYRAGESNPFSCPWDSGCVGFIFVSADDIRKEYGVKRISAKVREKAQKVLRAEVETYSAWASGDVWGYVVEDEDGEEVDSCWGFIGEPEYALSEGLSVARFEVARRRRARLERVKELIRARVPLAKRPAILAEISI